MAGCWGELVSWIRAVSAGFSGGSRVGNGEACLRQNWKSQYRAVFFA